MNESHEIKESRTYSKMNRITEFLSYIVPYPIKYLYIGTEDDIFNEETKKKLIKKSHGLKLIAIKNDLNGDTLFKILNEGESIKCNDIKFVQVPKPILKESTDMSDYKNFTEGYKKFNYVKITYPELKVMKGYKGFYYKCPYCDKKYLKWKLPKGEICSHGLLARKYFECECGKYLMKPY